MSKELFMACHEELMGEEMERTGCDYETAYDRTADMAYIRMVDRLADLADNYRDRMKEQDLERRA